MKLVRDNVAAIQWNRCPEAKACLRPVESQREHLDLLRAKLLEEVGELITASTIDDELEEIGDVLTALRAWAHVRGVEWDYVRALTAAKTSDRGGFERGTVLDLSGAWTP